MSVPAQNRSTWKVRGFLVVLCASLAGVLFTACGSSAPAENPGGSSQPTQAAAEVENNPPGDIPDNQVFVSYHSSAGGYSLDVPEGWARSETGPNVSFVDKLDSIKVQITSGSAVPTVQSVTDSDVPQLEQQVEAFEKVEIKAVDLPAGQAICIRYRANSAPDSVTGKKVRLEIDRYELFKDGKLAAISLAAPAGSDNVDVWKQISDSFRWS
jgi:hypothetical protein